MIDTITAHTEEVTGGVVPEASPEQLEAAETFAASVSVMTPEEQAQLTSYFDWAKANPAQDANAALATVSYIEALRRQGMTDEQITEQLATYHAAS